MIKCSICKTEWEHTEWSVIERHHLIYSPGCEGFELLNDVDVAEVDLINSPPHYTQASIECIDAIAATLNEDEFRGFCKANALKYIWREKLKGGDEDLKKAIWYLNRLVNGKEVKL